MSSIPLSSNERKSEDEGFEDIPLNPPPPPPPPMPHSSVADRAGNAASASSNSLLNQSKTFAEEQWQKAYTMLETNPNLMTTSILCLALKRRAPIQLIRFMLKLNPDAASIPKTGPSPLQIAVQSECSIDVIRLLIEQYPFALVATNPDCSHLNPLSYAKRFRSEETDLVRLLSLPVSHWVATQDKNPEGSRSRTSASPSASQYSYKPERNVRTNPTGRGGTKQVDPPLPIVSPSDPEIHQRKTAPRPSPASRTAVPPFLRYTCGTTDNTITTPQSFVSRHNAKISNLAAPAMDQTELNNIKLICLAVLKGHKRLAKEVFSVQKQLDRFSDVSAAEGSATNVISPTQPQKQKEDFTRMLKLYGASLMKKIKDQQKRSSRIQMIAMEMKEQAMHAYIRRVEHRVMKSVFSSKEETAASVEIRLDAIVQGLQMRLQTFTHRISRVEAFAQKSSNVNEANAQLKRGQTRSHSHKCTENRNNDYDISTPRTASTLSPGTYTYRNCPTFDSIDENKESTMPIMYSTPFKVREHEDTQSLLTQDTIVDRPSHHRSRHPKRAVIVGKRWLSVLCKQ